MSWVYKEPICLPFSEAEAMMTSERPDEVCNGLLSVTLYSRDLALAQSWCLRLAGHVSPEVRGLVATCIGHLARLHGQLDLTSAVETLRVLSLPYDATVAGRVADALEDVEQYLSIGGMATKLGLTVAPTTRRATQGR
jgi:hypothetical protein